MKVSTRWRAEVASALARSPLRRPRRRSTSAGKRRTGRTGHANRWLRAALTQAAHAATRKHGSYFRAQYHRIAARRGKKRATLAVAHSLLITIYYMLERNSHFADLGDLHFDRREATRLKNRLVHRLEGLGYTVTLEAA